ncbi:MAG: hypothetical protein NC340_03830 [Ruminococcus flavefaciens]|nr:hypothetical protein [Ruminococcus flavefaciens]MCM1229180.1 hypothetical protein [Ruminococcus flavefaciens]
MKKLISLMLVFSGLSMSLLTGCSGESAPESSEEVSRQIRVSSTEIDPEIIGSWKNDYNGYIFDADHKVSLIMDFSAMGNYFTSDGDFQMAGGIMTKDENITYDGTNLIIDREYIDEDDNLPYYQILLSMTRTDEANPDSYDGTYVISTGACIITIANMVGMTFEEMDNFTIEAEVKGDSFIITVKDYCDYETNSGTLELFSQYMNYNDESATSVPYSYKIEGDTLTLDFTAEDEVLSEVYQRVE